jgi:serine/threonine protein phosphatase PrpC
VVRDGSRIPAGVESVPVMPSGGGIPDPADDQVIGRVLADVLARSHLMAPDALTDVLMERAGPLGVEFLRIYLADPQQRHLHPLPAGRTPPPSSLAVDSTLAGRAFQTITIHHAANGEEPTGSYRLWVPLMDGTERLGVLELIVNDVDEATLDRCRTLASLTGLIVVSKSNYSDSYARVRRGRHAALSAEMVWAFMAPPTFATDQVVIAATLEPAYDVGGDAYDYSLMGDRLHVSIFDAAGHDLAAGLIASVAMAACRNSRRGDGDLTDIVARADEAIATQFGDSRFATALLCDLNTGTGELTWISCGHPPPLLIRDHKVIKELIREPWLPLGISGDDRNADPTARPPIHTEQLQPGDRILLYTDGVVEGRGEDGDQFGLERFSDFIIRNSAAAMPAPETLRRLNRAILDYQHGHLSDDATTVLIEWMPDGPHGQLTP